MYCARERAACSRMPRSVMFFFFQAEDGIRDKLVTGIQTCALPICELGIRMALGAQSRDVLRLVLGKGAVLVGIGALLGGFGAYGVSKLLISLIPSLPTRDPLILLFAALALIAVALLACYTPTLRATRVDPLVALKSE